MKTLIVAATRQEVEPLFTVDSGQLAADSLEWLVSSSKITANRQLQTANCKLLITGAGMVATAFAMARHLALNQYDMAINMGICGSFNRSIGLGEVVEITTDTLAELGAEDDERFLPIEQLGFGESVFNATASVADILNKAGADNSRLIKQTNGITVNTVHGNELHIGKITDRLNPQVESMEGAAFFYACHQSNLPCLQIRAVSNYVEKRNRDNWQIGLAVKNLNIFAGKLLQQLAQLP